MVTILRHVVAASTVRLSKTHDTEALHTHLSVVLTAPRRHQGESKRDLFRHVYNA